MLGFSPDPELTSCVAQPPVALADHCQRWKKLFQNHLHIIDNGKGHDKAGNK